MASNRIVRWVGQTAAVLLLSCAAGAPPPPQSGTSIPMGPPLSPHVVSRPEARVRPPAVRLLENAKFTLNVQDSELSSLLLGIGRDSPINIVVDPEVEGTLTADLRDVSLLEILDEAVVQRGYAYSVRGNVLRIYKPRRETRTYEVDYPDYQRLGASNVELGGFIGAAPPIGEGDSSGEDSSTAAVETTQSSDFYGQLEAGLRALVFGSSEVTSEENLEEGSNIEPRRVFVTRGAGIVSVTAEPKVLEQVEEYLYGIAESTQRQVLIDVQVVEVTLTDDLDLGVDLEYAPNWGVETAGVFARMITPGLREASVAQSLAPLLNEGGLSFGIARDDLGVVLTALAKQTDVRLVSTPRIATVNNHKAVIKVVRNEVFFVAEVENIITDDIVQQTTEFVPQIVPIGITLDVTPQISSESEILMHIHPSVSEIVDLRIQPTSDPSLPQNGSLPVVDVRETDTVLRVPDEATIVMGGLVHSREFEQERRVPVLGQLPLIGTAFRRLATEERRTELVLFLTPKVMDPPRIARITEGAQSGLDQVNRLRRSRQVVGPWWRRPLGETYGVQ